MILEGKEIKLKRIALNISQKDFARMLGVSQIILNKVENSKTHAGYNCKIKATEFFENQPINKKETKNDNH